MTTCLPVLTSTLKTSMTTWCWRDLTINGGLVPVTEEQTIAVRNRAARAIQAVFREFGFPEITDEEVEAATYAHGSKGMPPPVSVRTSMRLRT